MTYAFGVLAVWTAVSVAWLMVTLARGRRPARADLRVLPQDRAATLRLAEAEEKLRAVRAIVDATADASPALTVIDRVLRCPAASPDHGERCAACGGG